MVGPSRIGKTNWARSLGRHMFMSNMYNVSDWDSNADYIVLDDIPWKFVPAKKMLLGGQRHFSLGGKYARVRTVTWGKACIYCINRDEYNEMFKDFMYPWLEENCTFVFLENKLY